MRRIEHRASSLGPGATLLRTLMGVFLVASLAGLPGCEEGQKEYAQDSPEAVIDSARQMLEDGTAARLVELLPAATDNNRIVYQEAGRMLRSLQNLATTLESSFPDEIAELRADAEAAALRGDAISNLQQAVTGRGQRRGQDGESDERLHALLHRDRNR